MHVKLGQGQKALELFQQMQQEGVQPDSVTFVEVLNACANVVAVKKGQPCSRSDHSKCFGVCCLCGE
jgi:pentatricopeptide repeat protein